MKKLFALLFTFAACSSSNFQSQSSEIVAPIMYVDGANTVTGTGTQANPCKTIQTCLGLAPTGANIYVTGGTYIESLTVPDKGLTIFGGYAPGFGSRDTVAYQTSVVYAAPKVTCSYASGGKSTVCISYGVKVVTLDGLRITGSQHGVWVFGGGLTPSVAVNNCLIESNNAVGAPYPDGAGIYNDGGTLVVTNSNIRNNTASHGGAISFGGLGMTLTNSSITGDTAINDGGGVYTSGANDVFANNTFANNTAGSLAGGVAKFVGMSTFNNDVWHDNRAGSVGATLMCDDGFKVGQTRCDLTHELMYHNYGDSTIYYDDPGTILNISYSTIADSQPRTNGTSRVGLALTIQNSDLGQNTHFRNSIFGGNTTDITAPVVNPLLIDTSYSITQASLVGVHYGTGVVSADPMFVGGGDYHLRAGSPGLTASDTGEQIGYYGGLAGVDGGAPVQDMSVFPDLSTPRDMAKPVDLSQPVDLMTVPDLLLPLCVPTVCRCS